MSRNYTRKKPPPSYTKNELESAINMVKTQQMTLYRAAKQFKIPKPTLFKHCKGLRGKKSSTYGRPTSIPFEEEKKIADCLKTMEKWGFGLSKKEVLELIGQYVQANGINTQFKNGVPGSDYFIRFKKTFNLSQKKPQSVEVSRKRSVDPFIIDNYFKLLKDVTENIPPTQIYNIDESGFCLDPSRIKIVGENGIAAHRATSGPGRENVTVLLGGNAAGQKLPPLIIFKGRFVWDSWLPNSSLNNEDECNKKDEEYEGMTFAATKNGWIDTETFKNYFENSFLKQISSERPVVLIYDGHVSHLDISVVERAKAENVVILKLPPHSKHLLQPMDLTVFKSLKHSWDEKIIVWQRKNYGKRLQKRIVASIISKIWDDLNPSIIINGFRAAGIYPYCQSVIPSTSYEPTVYNRWLQFQDRNTTLTNEAIPASEILFSTPNTSQEKTRTLSFEDLLLNQVKQSAGKTTVTRRRVCNGAEVITSSEAITKLKEAEINKNLIKSKKSQQSKKKILEDTDNIEEEEEDDPVDHESQSSADDCDIEAECRDIDEENNFVNSLQKEELDDNDWFLAKFSTNKKDKLFVGKIVSKDPVLEAVFARRIGFTSSFHWPNVEDKSIIIDAEIFLHLPPPIFDKRGTFKFNISFDSYNIG